MATQGRGGVRIPLSLDKRQAEKDGRELAGSLRKSLVPVVDVVQAARTAFDAMKSAIGSAMSFARESIGAAAAQEVAELKLTAALSRRGKVSQDFIDKLNAENFARQQLLAISDDEQQTLQAKAALLDVDRRHLSKVTDATIGLAETTGQDLGGALNVVVKAYHGNIAALKKLGVQATDTDSILDELASRVDVSGQRANSFTGRVALLSENWSELMESFGEAVVRNDDVKKLLSDVNTLLLDTIKIVQEDGPEFKTFISGVVQDLRDLSAWVKENRGEIATVIQLMGALSAGRSLGGVSAGVAGAAGKYLPAAGTLGGLATKGLFGLGNTVAGAAGFGVAATAGMLLVLPSTDSAAVAEALKRDLGVVDRSAPQYGSPRFKNTAFAGQGLDSGVTFDVGSKVTVDSQKNREAAEKDALKRRDDAWKVAIDAAKERAAEVQRLREESERNLARWQDQELDSRRQFNASFTDLETERLIAQREAVDERNKIYRYGFESLEAFQAAERESMTAFGNSLGESAISGAALFVGNWSGGLLTGQEKIRNAGKAALGALLGIAGDAMLVLGAATTAAGFGSSAVPFLIPIFGGPAGIAAGFAISAAGAGLKAWGGSVASSARETVSQASMSGTGGARSSFDSTFEQRERPRYIGGNNGLGRRSIVNIILGNRNGGVILGDVATLARLIGDIMGDTAELRFE